MTTASTLPPANVDIADQAAGLTAGSPVHTLRHRRDKVATATQGSHAVLFDPALPGLPLVSRLAVALHAARLTPSAPLVALYRAELERAGAPANLVEALASGRPEDAAQEVVDARLRAALRFTRTLIENPVEGDRAALMALPAAGLATAEIVTLAQLIAYLSYQVRLVAGLAALNALPQGEPPASTTTTPAAAASGSLGRTIESHGFTNAVLDWKAWLDVVDLDAATPDQIAVLEESHPKAKVQDYYRFLVHQPAVLRQRSAAFNAIMYAPGGLPRAERELASTVVSRINGCVYCASVHAQRFEQLAKRNDVIEQIFAAPRSAGTTAREQAIARFSIALTEKPDGIGASDLLALREGGLTDAGILDLIHAIAIFAWANRLMLNLGEPEPAAEA